VHAEDGAERTRVKEIFKKRRRGHGSRRHCGSCIRHAVTTRARSGESCNSASKGSEPVRT
jgi:hypothetical protein